MICRSSVSVILAGLLCGACSAKTSPCGDEFFEGSVRFPDGTTHQACSPAGAEGIAVRWEFFSLCSVGLGGAAGSSSGGDVTWSVDPGWERIDPLYRGDWFAPAGPIKLSIGYVPTVAPPSRCVPGEPLACELHAYGCAFELTQAAVADGEMIEGHLTAPCVMRVGGDYANPWRSTLTSFRFRAHLSGFDYPDAGPCMIVDAGMGGVFDL